MITELHIYCYWTGRWFGPSLCSELRNALSIAGWSFSKMNETAFACRSIQEWIHDARSWLYAWMSGAIIQIWTCSQQTATAKKGGGRGNSSIFTNKSEKREVQNKCKTKKGDEIWALTVASFSLLVLPWWRPGAALLFQHQKGNVAGMGT
jgi:hypothetical protein